MPNLEVKMPRESAVDFMIRTVKDWMSDGVYKSGDRLPSEAELCQLTGISRGSIREAMKVLSTLGLVDIRRGNGTYITGQDSKPPVEPLLLNLQRSHWSVQDLMDFREQIEKSVIELIIRNANDEQIDLMEAANRRMKAEIDGENNQQRVLSYDIAFHRQMAKCTGNALFEILYNYTLDFIATDTERMYRESSAMGYISYLLHQRMVDAIRHRDLDSAKEAIAEAMQNHAKIGNKPETVGQEKGA